MKPIIAMTASAMKDQRRRCEEAGMDGFLAKPFKPLELFALVEKWGPRAESEAPDGRGRLAGRNTAQKGHAG